MLARIFASDGIYAIIDYVVRFFFQLMPHRIGKQSYHTLLNSQKRCYMNISRFQATSDANFPNRSVRRTWQENHLLFLRTFAHIITDLPVSTVVC